MEKYLNMTPGKYWKLPKHKKHLTTEYLQNKDYIPMVKYDGYWARAVIGKDFVTIQSRGISKVTGTYGEYQEKVPHIVDGLLKTFPSGTVVLGELYYPSEKKTVQDVGSILRCKPPKAQFRQKKDENKLHFAMFDLLSIGGEGYEEKPFKDRLYTLNGVNVKSNYIHVSEHNRPGEGEPLLNKTLENGGEGIILLNKNEPYNIGGAKAWHSIKVKKEMGEVEVPIISTIDPEKEYKGDSAETWKYSIDGELVSKFHYHGWKKGIVFDYNGNKVSATSGITEEDGAYLATEEAQKKIESGELYAVVTGMEITKDSIRHPVVIRLRDDI